MRYRKTTTEDNRRRIVPKARLTVGEKNGATQAFIHTLEKL